MSEPSPANVPIETRQSGQATQLEPAQPDDVWLSVHALSEWVFCPRAGIIAAAQRDGRLDEDWSRPNLDYSPCYELQQIEHELRHHIRRLWWWSFVSLGLLGVAGWAIYQGVMLIIVGSALGFLATGYRVTHRLARIEPLLALRQMALAAKPKTVELPLIAVESANWWELLAAGYQSVAYPAPLKDDSSKLCGRPWRVLRHGGLRIPVIKVSRQDGAGDLELRETHRVRLAAYRHLLVLCEAAEVPFGVILSDESYQGWLVPLADDARNVVSEFIQSFRQTLRANHTPAVPNAKSCARCPHGSPTEFRDGRETRLGGTLLRAFGFRGCDRRTYHSVCGDRFRWCPPHEQAAVLELPIHSPGHS